MYYVGFDDYEGEGGRVYRSVEEIRRDVNEIKEGLAEAADRLNVRTFISEVLDEAAFGDAGAWICQLNELIAQADETLMRMRELKEQLKGLYEELEDTLWLFGT